MKKIIITSVAAVFLVGCSQGTNPFETAKLANAEGDGTEILSTKDWIVSGEPGSNKSAGNVTGASNSFLSKLSGEIESIRLVSYQDQTDDITEILYVDNIPFDGITERPYVRDKDAEMNDSNAKLFRAELSITDPISGVQIGQSGYQAIYGLSKSGATEYVIVKTDGYIQEGFGGNVYQRNSFDSKDEYVRFSRPATGQAYFSGKYDGFRVKTDGPYMDRTMGDVALTIDFDDFNDRAAVLFRSTNRIALLPDATVEQLSPISTVVGSGTVDDDGSYSVSVFSRNEDGTEDGTGSVQGILAGSPPTEAVGMLTLTYQAGGDGTLLGDIFGGSSSFIETGGFFAYRDPE